MKIIIHSLYDQTSTPLEGDNQELLVKLMALHPWLAHYNGSLEDVLEFLASHQAFDVETNSILDQVQPEIPLGKSEPKKSNLPFDAVRFMTNGKPIAREIARHALWQEDGDVVKAALVAYGEDPTEDNIKAVKTWLRLARAFPDVQPRTEAQPVEVIAKVPEDGEAAAEAVKQAFSENKVFHAGLSGKHSEGSLLAMADSGTLLLKPGSNGQSVAAGAVDNTASQAQREAGFWAVASQWGIGQFIPRADLLLLGGVEMACIEMLPKKFKLLEDLDEENSGIARRLLKPYFEDGTLFYWAVIDFVLGNPDRHGRNIMADPIDNVVRLIDQGSAFAGVNFDPANDQNSFVPFYLRVWSPPRFNNLTPQEKLRYMPRLGVKNDADLKKWVAGLSEDKTSKAMTRYHIDPQASLARLARLKTTIAALPASLAVNMAWVGP